MRPAVQYGYDSSGRLTSIRQVPGYQGPAIPPPGTLEASFTWTSGGDLASITDGDGLSTTFAYDSSHRVTSVSQGKGSDQAVTRFDYVSSTQTDVADPDTDQSSAVTAVPHTTYTVDSTTKLVSKATDPLGHSRSATYTPFNDVASATNGVGGTATNSFSSGVNGGHSVTQSTSPTGASAKWTYGSGNSAYNPVGATDTQGNSSVMTYDGAGNPASTTAAGGAKAQVAFNSNGTLASSTDPAGNKTLYTNDSTHKYVTKISPPNGSALGATTISGVPADSVTNGAGQTTTYRYDTLDRVTQSSSADVTVNYAYSPAERLTSRMDNNQKVTYAYDNRGNLASVSTTPVAAGAPPASTVTYGYDKAGNMTSRTISGQTTSYTYDAAERLTSMTTPDGQVTRFGYDDNNRRTDTWWHTNSDHTTFAAHTHNDFDKSGRLTRTWTSRNSSDSTRIFDSTYSYAKSGKDTGLIQSITDNRASSNNTATLTYDSQNRLTAATNWHGHTYSYGYDSSGNRTSSTVDGTKTSLSFNADDEISSTGYGYDKAGRRVQDPHGGSMTYNSAGQMTKQVVGSNTGMFMYAGDTQDELIQQKTNSGPINYVYGRANQAGVPVLEEDTLPDSTSPVTFDNDAAGQPIDATQDGKDLYLVYDGLGQFIATMLPDGTQNGTNLELDPWGNWVGSESSAVRARAQGKVLNNVTTAASGSESPWTTIGIGDTIVTDGTWWKRGTRYNDTITGTWTSVDPITTLNNPSRANPYTYAGDDPINNIDPAGRLDWGELGTGVLDILGGSADVGVGIFACSLSLETGPGAIAGCGIGGLVGLAGVGEIALGSYEIWEGA